jgi:flagellar protein FliS
MNSSSAANAYRQAACESAPPLKIVQMLYAGALRFLQQAKELDPRAERARFQERLQRADAILAELRLALDAERAPELCQRLTALYLFAGRQNEEAHLELATAPLDAAIDVLETHADGWRSAERAAGQDA